MQTLNLFDLNALKRSELWSQFANKGSRVHYGLRAEVPSITDYVNIRLNLGLSRKSEEVAMIGL
jgi:hypothetical protein